MSSRCRQSSIRTRRRDRGHQLRWLGVESLERRDCPAVQAFLAGGVLSVVGDAGNNVIDLFEPRDGVVQVVGDGQTWVFEDVDEVFVDAGNGDDQTTYSKPKEIVVVGSKMHIDAGAGNDRVKIDGGESDGTVVLPRVGWEVSVELGTGADDLEFQAGDEETLNLDVRSVDGGDRVVVGHTIGLRHEHTRPESRIDMDLGGAGNFVEVRLENVDDVDLSIVSEPEPSEPATGGTINVYWHVINNGSTVNAGRTDGVVILYSSLPGGSASGVSSASLSLTGTVRDATSPSSASVGLDLGSDDDTVSIDSRGINVLDVNLSAGDGNDTVGIVTDGASNTVLVGERPPSHMVVDLGAGNDNLDLQTTDFGNVELDLTAGDGDDNVHTHNQVRTTALWGLRTHVRLGAGGDRLRTEVEGYGDVDTLVDGGPGDDDVGVHGTPAVQFYQFSSASMVVDLKEGANQLLAETTGFADVTQDFRGGGGNDQMTISDRAGPYFQFESKRLRQQIHTGGGNDIVLDDTAGSDDVQATIDMGSGDDLVYVITRYNRELTRQTSFIVDLSLGAGSDVALLDILGYSQIAATINTGPAGDGRDLVGASFRLTADDRLRRIRRTADGGQDLFELFVSAAYDVQMTTHDQSLIIVMTRSGN